MEQAEPWRQTVDAPGPQANRAALREIMAYWLDRGVAGFRVDMAYSLVKDDPDFTATAALWASCGPGSRTASPDAVLLPENDHRVTPGPRRTRRLRRRLLPRDRTGAQSAVQQQWRRHPAPRCPTTSAATSTPARPTRARPSRRSCGCGRSTSPRSGGHRLVVLPSADHDFSRLASGDRGQREQLGAAFAFLLTWGSSRRSTTATRSACATSPGCPTGKAASGAPGSTARAAAHPMQWDDAQPNAGFSTAAPEMLYLPQDPEPVSAHRGRPAPAQ